MSNADFPIDVRSSQSESELKRLANVCGTLLLEQKSREVVDFMSDLAAYRIASRVHRLHSVGLFSARAKRNDLVLKVRQKMSWYHSQRNHCLEIHKGQIPPYWVKKLASHREAVKEARAALARHDSYYC